MANLWNYMLLHKYCFICEFVLVEFQSKHFVRSSKHFRYKLNCNKSIMKHNILDLIGQKSECAFYKLVMTDSIKVKRICVILKNEIKFDKWKFRKSQQDFFLTVSYYWDFPVLRKAIHAPPFIVLVVSNALFWYYMKNSLGNRDTLKEYAIYKNNAALQCSVGTRKERLWR